MSNNYHDVLQVSRNSTLAEIRKKYKELAKIHHPDKGGDPDKFKVISEAYTALSEASKKKATAIDKPTHKYHSSDSMTYEHTIFGDDDFYECLDIDVRVILTTRDIHKGDPIEVVYNRYVDCDKCGGTGLDKEGPSDDCLMCDNTGRINGVECKYCHGKGLIYTNPCTKCDGYKLMMREEKFNINNIRRVRASCTDILAGYGHKSRFYDRIGSVNLIIIYEELLDYKILPDDTLSHDVFLDTSDMLSGTTLEYTKLSGDKVSVKVPPNSKNKDVMRLANEGLLKNDKADRGDLLLILNSK